MGVVITNRKIVAAEIAASAVTRDKIEHKRARPWARLTAVVVLPTPPF